MHKKEIKGRTYFYTSYRDKNGKIKTKYLGSSKKEARKNEDKFKHRKRKKTKWLFFIILAILMLGLMLALNVSSENITLQNYSEATSTNLTPEFEVTGEINLNNDTGIDTDLINENLEKNNTKPTPNLTPPFEVTYNQTQENDTSENLTYTEENQTNETADADYQTQDSMTGFTTTDYQIQAIGICDEGDEDTSCNITTPKNFTVNLELNFSEVFIKAGGSIELSSSANLTLNASTLYMEDEANISAQIVNITVDSIEIADGATINVNAKGFGAGSGPGAAPTSSSAGSGSSYGGTGGLGGVVQPGNPYGSITEPYELGSGGGCAYNSCVSYPGSPGGGAIYITATGTLNISGTLTANGGTLGTAHGGGGSGGSIYIRGATIISYGNISANGGIVSTSSVGGAGGGGRVAIHYSTYDFSGWINATGGKSLASGQNTYGNGSAGTIYFNQVDNNISDLIIDNTEIQRASAPTPVWGEFDTINITGGGNASISPTDELIVNYTYLDSDFAANAISAHGNLTILNPIESVGSNTIRTLSNFSYNHSTIENLTLAYTEGTLEFLDNSIELGVTATLQMEYKEGGLTLDELNATDTSKISMPSAGSTNYWCVNITANNITIYEGAMINANGVGNSSASGPGAGVTSTSSTGGGGSYGGRGGRGEANGGTPGYGSIAEPLDFGSGGGCGYNNCGSYPGAAGGGCILLNATDTLNVSGTISANGGGGTWHGASGSGGSVYLIGNTVTGYGNITANGGTPTGGAAGAGGAGRVALHYTNYDFSGWINATGGASITTTAYSNGSAGTIYLKDLNSGKSDLIIDNAPMLSTNEETPVNINVDAMNVTGRANVTILSTDELNISYVYIDQSSSIIAIGNLTIETFDQISGSVYFWDDLNLSNAVIENLTFYMTGDNAEFLLPSTSFEVGNSATLEVGRTTGLSFTNLDVKGTLRSATNSASTFFALNITAENLTVFDGGTIHVSARGNASASGPGAGGTISSTSLGGGGGGYGGEGGTGTGTSSGAPGASYGNFTEPLDLGSGGGCGYSTCAYGAGGYGGGLIFLNISDTLNIAGQIQADGGAGSTASSYDGGGGSGGSVYLITNAITGNGNVTAIGGVGALANQGGGGGGGRIAIYYTTYDFSGDINATGNGGAYVGGAGTIYLKDNLNDIEGLIIANNGTSAAGGTPFEGELDSLNVTGNANATLTSDKESRINNTIILSSSTYIDISGNLTIDNFDMLSGSVVVGGILNISTNIIENITLYYFDNGVLDEPDNNLEVASGAILEMVGDDEINFNQLDIKGTLRSATNSASTFYVVNITAANITLWDTGSITVSARGNATASGPGAGGTISSTSLGGGGGGYGGEGGNGTGTSSGVGGVTYGSATLPLDLGSGGGCGYSTCAYGAGGYGGGLIFINTTENLNITGEILADGGAGSTASGYDGGGGSGGSIYLIGGIITGTGNVTAIGGAGALVNQGGGGGGGRIAFYYGTSFNYVGTNSTAGGTGAYSGSTGTVYISDLSAPAITLKQPENNSEVTSPGEVNFTFSVSSDVDVINCTVHINEEANTSNQTDIALNTDLNISIGLTQDIYNWSVRCIDVGLVEGVSETWAFSFFFDVDAPNVTLENPEDNATNVTTNTIDFTYNVTDTNAIDNCSLIINDETNITDTTMQKDTAEQNLTTYLPNGEYNWNINCTDSSNNIGASETRNISINYIPPDTTPPDINFIDPTPPHLTQTSNTSIEVNISITENQLANFIWNWNETNYTIYSKDLLLMLNFDNNTAIEENDTHAVDVSNYSNNGTIYGAVWTKDGKYGSALSFDGTDDYVDLGSSDIFEGMNKLTLMAWINTSTDSADHVIAKGNTGDYEYALRMSFGNITVVAWQSLGANHLSAYSSVFVNDSEWHHIVGIIESGVRADIYVDGVLSGSNTAPSGTWDNIGPSNLRIGGRDDGVNNFTGMIDDVHIYNRSLSAEEIQQHYYSNLYKYDVDKWAFYTNQSNLSLGNYTYFGTATDINGNENSTEVRTIKIRSTEDTTPPDINFIDPTPPDLTQTSNTSVEINISITETNLSSFTWNWNGTNYSFYDDDLILMFEFENNSALGENDTFIIDLSKYENNGTFTNNATIGIGTDTGPTGVNESGRYNRGWAFDGDGDYIITNTSLPINGNNSFTIEAWIKLNDSSRINTIVEKYTVGNEMDLWVNYQTAEKASLILADGVDVCIAKSTTNVTDDNWHHIVGVRNFTSRNLTIYVDGVMEEGVSDSACDNAGDPQKFISIGATDGGADGSLDNYFFNGTIDEVRIYNRSLTADEIKQHYQSNLYKYDSDKWAFYTNQSNLSLGNYTYFATATDQIGNENMTETRNIIINYIPPDITAPIVALELPEDNTTNTTSNWIDLTYNVTDDGTLANCTLIINYELNITDTTMQKDTAGQNLTTYLNNGTYTWSVNCTDNSNNIGTSETRTLSVDYDSIPPDITFVDPTPNDAEAVNTSSITTNITSNENLSSCTLVWSYGSQLLYTGDGSDGALTVSTSDTIVNNYSELTINITEGMTEIEVANAEKFSPGDEIMIMQMQNGSCENVDAGAYEFATITNINGNNLTLGTALTNRYNSGGFDSTLLCSTQVVNVRHYTNVNINNGASISGLPWDGRTGGIVAFRATGTVTVNGYINITGLGFRGGVEGFDEMGFQGESYNGLGIQFNDSNEGGGGGGDGGCTYSGGYCTSGAGGGHSIRGTDGISTTYGGTSGTGGKAYAYDNTSRIYFGSGGGGGSREYGGDKAGNGSTGGGIILINADIINIVGNVTADGEAGKPVCMGCPGPSAGVAGGGGGGAGGTIILAATTITVDGNITAIGGLGGSASHSGYGGNGGFGRIYVINLSDFSAITDPDYNLTDTSLLINTTNYTMTVENADSLTTAYYTVENMAEDTNYSYFVSCTDIAGNLNQTETRSINYIHIDITAPVVNLEAPEDNAINLTSNTIDFTYNVSDFKIISNCSLIIQNDQDININLTASPITKDTTQNLTTYLPNGEYNWSVNCTDNSNNEGNSEWRYINVTYTPPTLTITLVDPYEDKNIQQYSLFNFTVEVTCSDANCSEINISLDSLGLITTQEGATPFYITSGDPDRVNPQNISLNAWENTSIRWELNATGSLNTSQEFFVYGNVTSDPSISTNTSTINITIVTIDAEPPLVEFVPPTTETGNYTQNFIEVNISASDNTEIGSIVVNLYNSTGLHNTSNSTAPFFVNYTNLPDGTYYLNGTASDTMNNQNDTETRIITLDTTAPTITISSPQNITYNYADILVNITAQDSLLGTDTIWYNWNETNISYTGEDNITFNEGTNIIYVYSNDTLGNEASSNVTFIVDTGGPTVRLVSPDNAAITANITQPFQCNITDTISVANLSIYIWNSSASTVYTSTATLTGTENNKTFSYTFTYNDNYKWNCLGSDGGGNEAWSEDGNYTITISNNPPNPPILNYPGNYSDNIEQNPLLNITVTDPDGDPTNVSFYNETGLMGTVNNVPSGSNATHQLTNLQEATTYTWYATVTDGINSITSETWTFTTANFTPPTIIVYSPQNTTYGANDTLIKFTSPDSDLDTLWYYNETANVTYTAEESIIVTEGSHTFIFYANDTSGNENSTKVTFFINLTYYETTIPTINLEAPEDDTTNTSTNIIGFTYNVTDESAISNCSLIINNQINTTSTSIQRDTPGQTLTVHLNNGEYLWSINCTDSSNNIGASETRNLSIDVINTAPNFETIYDFEVNEDFGSFTINLQNNVSDFQTPLNYLTYNWTLNDTTILNLSITNTTGIATFTSQANASGYVLIAISVVDTEGLSNSTEFMIIVNELNDIPWVDLDKPDNGAINTTSNTIDFTYTPRDVESSISNCSLIINKETNSTGYAVSIGTINNLTTYLPDGNYNWSINCTDTGNAIGASTTRSLTVFTAPDVAAPTLYLVSPENNTIINTTEQTFTCNITDNLQVGNLTLYIWDNGTVINTNTSIVTGDYNLSEFSYKFTYLGTFNWNCLGTDMSGNNNWSEDGNYTIIIQNNAPDQPALNYPQDGATNVEKNPILNITVTDQDNDQMNISFYQRTGVVFENGDFEYGDLSHWYNTSDWNLTNEEYASGLCTNIMPINNYMVCNIANITRSISYNLSSLRGAANLTLFGITACNGQMNNKAEIYLDNTLVGTFDSFTTSWTEMTIQNVNISKYSELTINISTGGEGSEWCFDKINGATDTLLNVSYNLDNGAEATYQLNNLEEKETYLWYVNITDEFKFTTSTIWNFTTGDFTPPTITVYSPQNITYDTNETIINFTATDNYLDTLWYYNETENVTYTGEETINFTDGSHTLIFYANDTSGNENSTKVTFTINITFIDNNPPIVTLELPENNITNTTTNTIDFTYNITEENAVVNCSLIINDEINVTDTGMSKDTAGQTFTVYLPDAEYNWSINCTDNYNNIGASETRNLSVLLVNANPLFEPIASFSRDEDFPQFTINLQDNVSDAEDADNLLTYNWTNSNPSLLTVDIVNATGTATFISHANQSGSATITISVVDTGDLSNSTTFTLTLNAVNDAPWWDPIDNATAFVDEDSYNNNISNQIYWQQHFRDVEDDQNPSNPSLNTNDTSSMNCSINSGDLICDSKNNATGSIAITLTAQDSEGLSSTTDFEIGINAVNDAPWIDLDKPDDSTINTTTNTIDFTYIPYYVEGSISNCSLIINDEIKITDSTIISDVLSNLTTHLDTGKYSWRINCTDYENSITASETRSLNVSYVAPTPPTPPAPPGGDGGRGGRVARRGISVDTTMIDVELTEKEETAQKISITNTGDEDALITIDHNLGSFIQIKEKTFTLTPGETKEIKVKIIGEELGIKAGRIKIETEGIVKVIPVIIEVSAKKVLFDIKLEILTEGTKVTHGMDLSGLITIINMMPGKEDVILEYTIRNFYGEVLYKEIETLAVEKQNSFKKTFKTSELEVGDYVAGVILTHPKTYATSAIDFNVVEKKIKREEIVEFTDMYIYLASAMVLLLIVVLIIRVVITRRYKQYEKKERS